MTLGNHPRLGETICDCPFCGYNAALGSAKIHVDEYYFVRCCASGCRATGPLKKTEKMAVRKWNQWIREAPLAIKRMKAN